MTPQTINAIAVSITAFAALGIAWGSGAYMAMSVYDRSMRRAARRAAFGTAVSAVMMMVFSLLMAL